MSCRYVESHWSCKQTLPFLEERRVNGCVPILPQSLHDSLTKDNNVNLCEGMLIP